MGFRAKLSTKKHEQMPSPGLPTWLSLRAWETETIDWAFADHPALGQIKARNESAASTWT